MPVDPQVQKILDQIAARGATPLYELSPAEARKESRKFLNVFNIPPEEVARVEERDIPGPGGPLPIRGYYPSGVAAGEALPVLMNFHGGGHVIGSLDSDDPQCRYIANHARCLVVSVDYRLAPEHKFPADVEDAMAATVWVSENAAQLGGDARRIAVCGTSAGGTLATDVALLARDAGGPAVVFQIMIVPTCAKPLDVPSHKLMGKRHYITPEIVKWYNDHYLNNEEEKKDPRYAPVLAEDLTGLPPALIITAEFCPFRDEGKLYADKLAAAGVPVEYSCYQGQIHTVFSWGGVCPAGRRVLDQVASSLKKAFKS